MIFNVGQILLIEKGVYSDFSYDGPFRVARNFDQAEAVKAFRASLSEDDLDDTYKHHVMFLAWLSREGFIDDVPAYAWYIGDGFEPEIADDPAQKVVAGRRYALSSKVMPKNEKPWW